MTKTNKIFTGLMARGWQETPSSSRKYRRFTHPNIDKPIWLGKSGALRIGRNASNTIPVPNSFLTKVLASAE